MAKAGEAEIWSPTQPPEKVRVNTTYLGGGFGRRFAPDFAIAATLLSKVAGAPVKLVYTREYDMRAWFYRPAVECIKDCPYAFPNLPVEQAQVEPGVQVWFWRSVGHSQNAYFLEAFFDEIATAAGKDPATGKRVRKLTV